MPCARQRFGSQRCGPALKRDPVLRRGHALPAHSSQIAAVAATNANAITANANATTTNVNATTTNANTDTANTNTAAASD